MSSGAWCACVNGGNPNPVRYDMYADFLARRYHIAAPKLPLPLLRLEWRKVGGIRFWRVGRLGGSFYISR